MKLTTQQETRILDLRTKGYSYRYISGELTLPLEAIRNYASRHKLTTGDRHNGGLACRRRLKTSKTALNLCANEEDAQITET